LLSINAANNIARGTLWLPQNQTAAVLRRTRIWPQLSALTWREYPLTFPQRTNSPQTSNFPASDVECDISRPEPITLPKNL